MANAVLIADLVDHTQQNLQSGIVIANRGPQTGQLWPPDVSKKSGKKARTNKLVFHVDAPPASFPLFDLRGRDQVRQIAESLKRQWTGQPTSGVAPSQPIST
jgi:hypothetical protein